jgi:hypothetical protein
VRRSRSADTPGNENLGGGDPNVYDEAIAFKETEKIGALLAGAFERADREGVTPHEAAVRLAKDKIRERRTG